MTGEGLTGAQIASPKLAANRQSWYDYYASYSTTFAHDAIGALLPEGGAPKLVLDPWNGSGTTTIASSLRGHRAIGVDRNPALVVIAKGRHLPSSVRNSLGPLAKDIAQVAVRLVDDGLAAARDDGLSVWFTPDTTTQLRALERAVEQILVDEQPRRTAALHPTRVSTLAAFFYCALFTVVRQLTNRFRASNPTWIRRPPDDAALVSAEWASISAAFFNACSTLEDRLVLEHDLSELGADLRIGAAERLRVPRVNLTLGSPPYCTRIDYVVATAPELAVLGYRDAQIQRLRHAMLGSPLTSKGDRLIASKWGPAARAFLQAVETHRSKASSTYYFRYYHGYLRGLHAALTRLDHVTRRDGTIALVVQDSYYKETRFDLPTIVAEMGKRLGRTSERLDFNISRTRAAMHPGSRAYRKDFDAVESLVVLHGQS